MKIVSWNCRNGFSETKKKAILESEKSKDTDIFVIQECKREEIESFGDSWLFKNWYGDNLESDLGIAVFSKLKMKFTDDFNRNFRYVIPYEIYTEDNVYKLFVIWTKSSNHGSFYYDKNVIEAVDWYHKKELLKNAIFIGDYNTYAKNEAELEFLEKKLILLDNCSKYPKEKSFRLEHTYIHTNNETGIDDFCFATRDIAEKAYFKVYGLNKTQNKYWNDSDHSPISVEFKINIQDSRTGD